MSSESTDQFDTSPSFIVEHVPDEKEVKYKIGPYQIIREIGKGGMGEVLLGYDTNCGRRIALKKIREDLLKHRQMHNRFLKEAHITSQLTHPAIIPIYTIQDENNVVYYTMPFVKGETLRQIIRKTREQQKKGEQLHHIGSSIPALIRIFITVCQAVAYAHSKGVLHRDLKPDNIIIGKYGEVLILDWGLAKLIGETESDELDIDERTPSPQEITRIGKVVGTVTFMAPERGKGNPATIKTEVYALGVTLYQILTLLPPFARGTLDEFRKNMDEEELVPPSEVAPYRDVPRILSRITTKCLAVNPMDRYQSVEELIRELENYIEGRSEWFDVAELSINRKEDWEFQEHVLLTEHIAITRSPEVSEWVNLMISQASFSGNTKIEAKVKIGEKGHGIGFLLSIPEAVERAQLNEGYCLWLGSDINKSTKLLRSSVEVLHAPEVFLKRNSWVHVRIEKIDHNLFLFIDDILQFSYISHLPLVGTHVGILSRDADYEIKELSVHMGSQNITVNCLAVPDAFLAHKNYATALNEYRRIGYSFPGRVEGREAMFRAGITLLEKAKASEDPLVFEQALEEFENLRDTPGAPLEYLGKAHVYRALKEYDEEIKCFELAFRRFTNHPLLPILQEQILYRMHESSHFDRKAAYNFILTAVRHLPKNTISTTANKLFTSLEKHWETLHFILPEEQEECRNNIIAVQLAFRLGKPYILAEIIDELLLEKDIPYKTVSNAFFCLIELGAYELAQQKLSSAPENSELKLIKAALDLTPPEKKEKYSPSEMRLIYYLMETALNKNKTELVLKIGNRIDDQRVDCYRIWAFLLDQDWDMAGKVFEKYPIETLTDEDSLFHLLYGCWLSHSEGQVIADIHFEGILEVTYPRSHNLLAHYLNGKITEDKPWRQRAFLWETRQLYRQLVLYYTCINALEKTDYARTLEAEQYLP